MERWITLGVIAILIGLMFWCLFAGGPVWLYRKIRGRSRAAEGDQRRELVRRVQQLLPQAREDTVLFSMEEDRRVAGGSQLTVFLTDYIPRIFVVDGEGFWVIPVEVGRKHQYQLGKPFFFSQRSVASVELEGVAGKREKFTFYLKTDQGHQPLAMVVEPFLYRKNRHCPVDLVQEAACERAVAQARRLASVACGMNVEDLEDDRSLNHAVKYGAYAGTLGLIGLMLIPGENSVIPVTAFFVAALFMLAQIIRHGRMPKISALVVLVEALVAYYFLK